MENMDDEMNFSFDHRDIFLVTAHAENGDKLAAIECWSISAHSCQSMRPFRNSFVAPGTLQFIGNEYICGAAIKKPWISVWPMNLPTPVQPPLLTPATVNVFAVSPEGEYLVAAIGNKLYFWDLETGDFLALLSRHYQPISALCFSSTGRYFASAGTDGMVILWKTYEIVSSSSGASQSPATISIRSQISSMKFAGDDVSSSYLVLVGSDHACHVYESSSPETGAVGTFVFRRPLIAVTSDACFTSIAVSDDSGDIFRIPTITKESRIGSAEVMSEMEWNQRHKFAGHSKPARCLSFTADASLLVSGGDDATLRVWQVRSDVCIRVITMKGPVSNLLRCPRPEILSSKHSLSKMKPLVPLKKQLYSEMNQPFLEVPVNFSDLSKVINKESSDDANIVFVVNKTSSNEEEVEHLQGERMQLEKEKADLVSALEEKDQEILSLKSTNFDLYSYARELIFKEKASNAKDTS